MIPEKDNSRRARKPASKRFQPEEVLELARRYMDRYGWDVVDDERGWRRHQRHRMAVDYCGDRW